MTQGDFISFILAVFMSGITTGRGYSSPYKSLNLGFSKRQIGWKYISYFSELKLTDLWAYFS